MLLPLLPRGFSRILLVLLVLSGGGWAQAQQALTTRTVQPGRLVFKLRTPPGNQRPAPGSTGFVALDAALAQLDARALRPKFPRSQAPGKGQVGAVDLRQIHQVELPATTSVEAACRALRKTGTVAYAEPLYTYTPLYQPSDPRADSVSGGQYHLRNIRAYRAWDITKGDTSIVIGIVDGGTRLTHEDLASQLQVNRLDPIDGLDNDQDGYVDNYYGWDFGDNDNDPTREPNSVHGVLVAGCAVAATDNARGIAGVGFRCRFMPLKIYPSTPGGSFGGYEAIVYAADHGCKVINLSWGGVGGHSQFEQDVITYAAVNRDAVLVAAAGNTPADLDFYPASYDHVLSVATLTATDERNPSATFSPRVDLSAPGTQILTTFGNTDSDYLAVGGSSFAAPLVAGAAGLVRARFPEFNSAQVAAQLRRTTDNIDALPGNVAYVGRLGSGRLNVLKAVTETGQYSARLVTSVLAPNRRAFSPGDTLTLTAQIQNMLQPVRGLVVTLTSLSPDLVIEQDRFAVGALTTLERSTNSATPYRLRVAAGTPLNTRAVLRYRFTDAASGYQEDQYETLLLNPDYVVLDVNYLALTLTSRGNIGYDGPDFGAGESVRYRNGPPLLAEGGLLLATSATRATDNVRNEQRSVNTDFTTLVRAHLLSQPVRATQEASSTFQDSLPTLTANRTLGLRVRQHAYAWNSVLHRNYVILEYRLTNLTADTIRPLHVGLFLDWDLPGEPGRNKVEWEAARRLQYLFDATDAQQYAGLAHLTGGTTTAYAVDNQSSNSISVRLNDGFSTAEKFTTLSSGTQYARLATATDASQVTGARLAYLAPSDSAVVAFAMVAAPSLAQLQAAADAAATRYQLLLPNRPPQPAGLALYPNPTTGLSYLTLPPGTTRVQVLSTLGQVLSTHNTATTTLTLDLRRFAPGLYVVRVQTPSGPATLRLVHQP